MHWKFPFHIFKQSKPFHPYHPYTDTANRITERLASQSVGTLFKFSCASLLLLLFLQRSVRRNENTKRTTSTLFSLCESITQKSTNRWEHISKLDRRTIIICARNWICSKLNAFEHFVSFCSMRLFVCFLYRVLNCIVHMSSFSIICRQFFSIIARKIRRNQTHWMKKTKMKKERQKETQALHTF